jgi:hypothetical protein
MVHLQRTGQPGLEDEQLFLRDLVEYGGLYVEVLREHLLGRVRKPIRNEKGVELIEITVVEDQQEAAAIRTQALDRMRNTGRE